MCPVNSRGIRRMLTRQSAPSVLVTILLAACAGGDSDSGPPRAGCLRIGYLDITASAPLFVAQETGLFDSVGVCVSTEIFGTSNQLVDAIAADRIDYVVEVSAVPALALAARDPNRFAISAASTISPEEPFDAIVALRTSGIAALSDLAEGRVAVFPGTTATALLRRFLEDSGVDASSIRFVPVSPGNQLAALTSGAVDAVHAYEPTWAVALGNPAIEQVHGTVYGRQLSPNPQGVSLLSRGLTERNPEAAGRVVAAFDAAISIMRNDDSLTRGVLRERFDLPGDAVERMHLLYMAPSDSVDWVSLAEYADLLVSAQELDVAPDLDALHR
jgi:ABC-type nitrate/sulfonate/bicarbonate transport system substrate-binding protein